MKILIVGIGCDPPKFLDEISKIFFTNIEFGRIDLIEEAFDRKRNQYDAEKILHHVRDSKSDADKVLGIVDKDIFVEGLNFVFGLSEINGKNCIISTFRLKPEFYGKKNEKLFRERVLKEAVHELGHSFGLVHCSNKKCVMSFSNSIAEVDEKGESFCEKCAKAIKLKKG
jgi:archaemetzincin